MSEQSTGTDTATPQIVREVAQDIFAAREAIEAGDDIEGSLRAGGLEDLYDYLVGGTDPDPKSVESFGTMPADEQQQFLRESLAVFMGQIQGIASLGGDVRHGLVRSGFGFLVVDETTRAKRTALLASQKRALAEDEPVEGGDQTEISESVLSRRQRMVMQAMLDGMTRPEIAERLHIAESTTKNNIQAIYKRLGAKNAAEAMIMAYQSENMRPTNMVTRDPGMGMDILRQLKITDIEMVIIVMSAEGKSLQEMADFRGTSPKTIKNQLDRIRSKLGVNSQAEIVLLAMRHGLVSDQPRPELII